MKKILTAVWSICLVLCLTLVMTACDVNDNNANNGETNTENSEVQATFACSSKTFVYDKWEATAEVDEDDRTMFDAMCQVTYGHTQFVFDVDGNSCVWNKIGDPEDITLSGSWSISGDSVVITKTDLSTEVLHIVGLGFYVVQPGMEYDLHIYFKLA